MIIRGEFVTTAIICYAFAVMGFLLTLPSITLTSISAENIIFDRIMTQNEVSLLGSLPSVGAVLAVPLCGYLQDKIGRKPNIILFYSPQVFAWALVVIFNKVEAVLCATFLSGLSNSLLNVVAAYINEYSRESIRGSMTILAVIFYGIGMTTSYLIGNLLHYKTITYFGLTASSMALVMLCFIKESPLFLIMKGLEKEATEAIAFYRSCKPNTKENIEAIENIRRIVTLNMDMKDATPEEETLKPGENPKFNISFFKFMAKSRSSRRILCTMVILFTTCILQGFNAVLVFVGPLFAKAVPYVSSTLVSVLFGTVILISGVIVAYFIDTFGRKMILVVASFASGVFCAILGTQLQFNWGAGWVTVTFMLLYAVACNMGAGFVCLVLVNEVFLPEIKSLASMICLEWYFICNFIMIFIFNPLANIFGLGAIFYIFGCFCFTTAIFSFIFLPETKGLQVDEIQKFFSKSTVSRKSKFNYT